MLNAAGLIDWFALLALTAALLAAASTDAATYLIPNRFPAAIAIAFLVFAIDRPLQFWLAGFAVSAALLLAGIALFARGALGGGDVKLLSAVGLWAGQDQVSLLLFATALAGGALALAHLSPLHRLLPTRAGDEPAGAGWRDRLHQPVPFGIAIAFGGVCVALSRSIT
jgi:prepilin peptidase CpaA